MIIHTHIYILYMHIYIYHVSRYFERNLKNFFCQHLEYTILGCLISLQYGHLVRIKTTAGQLQNFDHPQRRTGRRKNVPFSLL